MAITVTSGASQSPPLGGGPYTVGQLRELFADSYNIPAGARALYQGRYVDDSEEVEDGVVAFQNPSGSKG